MGGLRESLKRRDSGKPVIVEESDDTPLDFVVPPAPGLPMDLLDSPYGHAFDELEDGYRATDLEDSNFTRRLMSMAEASELSPAVSYPAATQAAVSQAAAAKLDSEQHPSEFSGVRNRRFAKFSIDPDKFWSAERGAQDNQEKLALMREASAVLINLEPNDHFAKMLKAALMRRDVLLLKSLLNGLKRRGS